MRRRVWATYGLLLGCAACGEGGEAGADRPSPDAGLEGAPEPDDPNLTVDDGSGGGADASTGGVPDGELPAGHGGELGNGVGTSTSPGTADYPASVLCNGAERCGPGFDPNAPLSKDALAALYEKGMSAWRRPGLHGSCAGCHTPDAIDLAWIGYTDEDIARRAVPHHEAEPELADDIVGLVHAVRQLYQIENPLDPFAFRPFQPGFEVLPGETAEDRDLSFLESMQGELALSWAKDTIDSSEKAKAAAEQLAAIDLRQMRVGLPFDRWSEDTFHTGVGDYAEWIPGMGQKPRAGQEAAWYAVVDAYLTDPSDANLWAYYDAIDTLTEGEEPVSMLDAYPLATEWMLLKWKAVQIAGHMLRHRSIVYPDVLADKAGDIVQNRQVAIARSPVWHAGDLLRRNPATCVEATPNADPGNDDCTTFPPFVNDTIEKDADVRDQQNEQFKKSWFWTGWQIDHALVTTDDNLQTISGDYLMSTHLAQYKIHHAFIVAKLSVAKAYAKRWFSAQGESLDGHGKWASIRPFLVFKHIERNRNAPGENDPRFEGHRRMFGNLVRMWIYLVHDDLKQSGEVFDRQGVKAAIHFARSWLDETQAPALEPAVDHTDLDALISEIDALADAATELRTDFENGHVQLD